jgi:hypothetical protein
MSHTLRSLDAEWRRLTRTSRARQALRQWSIAHPALRGVADLDALLERRRDDQAAPAILRALAVLAPGDDLAARTLLQALLPGLVRLAGMVGYDDPAAIEEMVSLAWERIRTYPARRRGSVAANVLFDVRKRYRAHRLIDAPRSPDTGEVEAAATSRSPEDEALARVLFDQLMAAQRDERVLRNGAFGLAESRRENQVVRRHRKLDRRDSCHERSDSRSQFAGCRSVSGGHRAHTRRRKQRIRDQEERRRLGPDRPVRCLLRQP